MYQAELHGKLSRHNEKAEDILTSNFFSFLKYTDRAVFLKRFLDDLQLSVTPQDCKQAEFVFWPNFDDHTQPDLVLFVGDYYILIEAKYFEDFAKQAKDRKQQLVREIEGGTQKAKEMNRQFKLMAITADYCFKPERFKDVPESFRNLLLWVSWRRLASLILGVFDDPDIILDQETYEFAQDMYELLVRKNLRSFRGMQSLRLLKGEIFYSGDIFFQYKKAWHRQTFIGFIEALSSIASIGTLQNILGNLFFMEKETHNEE